MYLHTPRPGHCPGRGQGNAPIAAPALKIAPLPLDVTIDRTGANRVKARHCQLQHKRYFVGVSTERRMHHRFKYKAFITHDILSVEKNQTGQLMDFSEGGLYFESNQSLQRGEKIDIWIRNDHTHFRDDHRLLFGIQIIWHQNLYGSYFKYGYGASFINADNPLMQNVDLVATDAQCLFDTDFKAGTDSREHPRKNYNKSLSFSYQNRRFRGSITNISRGGAFIETPNKFSLGKAIRISLPKSRLPKPAGLKGWVVRLNQNGVGVKFERRSGRERRSDLDRRTGLDRRHKARHNLFTK